MRAEPRSATTSSEQRAWARTAGDSIAEAVGKETVLCDDEGGTDGAGSAAGQEDGEPSMSIGLASVSRPISAGNLSCVGTPP